MTIKSSLLALMFGILLWTCCTGAAQAQSCLHEPRGNACYHIFGFTLGEPYIPSGATCYCGGAAPLQETDCWVPLCTKHVCPTCEGRSAGPGDGPATGPSAGKPILLATGNTYIGQRDIEIPGLGGGLVLIRTWNSTLRASLSGAGMFGPNWRSTYEERIYVDDDDTVAYARGDGSVWNFVYATTQTFAPAAPANVSASLLEGTTAWTLTFKNGDKRVFDAKSGNLLSIIDRNGNTTLLSYDVSFRLVTVTDPASRHLYFVYASPTSFLVTGVSTDVGISLSYSYDNQGRLIRYTKPDNTTVSFQYNDRNPTLITAVLDSNGKVLESHTYDNEARGLTSSRAGGVEALTVTYPPETYAIPQP